MRGKHGSGLVVSLAALSAAMLISLERDAGAAPLTDVLQALPSFFKMYPQINQTLATHVLQELKEMDHQKLLVISTLDETEICSQISCLGIDPKRVTQRATIAKVTYKLEKNNL